MSTGPDEALRARDRSVAQRVPIPGELRGEVMVFQPMSVLDVSAGGAQIETTFPLQLDSLHEFRLSLGDRSVVMKARVARCEIAELQEGTVRYRSGIEFVDPPQHAAEAIRAFIDLLLARQRRPPVIDGELAED